MSYSQASVLQQCERRWSYHYLENLRKDTPQALPLLAGTAWHAVLAARALERGRDEKSLLQHPSHIDVLDGLRVPGIGLEVVDVLVELQRWEQLEGADRQEEMLGEWGVPLSTHLEARLRAYEARWGSQDQNRVPLLVEASWTRLAPNERELTGRVDLVLYDRDEDLVVVVDWKGHSKTFPGESNTVLDLMDSQLNLAGWGIAPELRRLGGENLVPQAVEFDRARLKRPTTPKLTAKGVLSKTVSDFDLDTYRDFCESEEALAVGYEYEEAIATRCRENLDAWFRRSLKPLNMHAVKAHVTSLMHVASRASNITVENAVLSPSKACQWCPYAQICKAELTGGRIPAEETVWADFGLRQPPK